MTPEQLEAILNLPLVGLLMFLLYRESAQKEKLLGLLVEITQKHAKDLLELALHGKLPDDFKTGED